MSNVSYAYGDQKVIDKLSLTVMRGERIGLVGNNGVGKSTLLRLMLGERKPQEGTVKLGTNLEVAYFDQMRRELDPNRSVADIVGDGRDYIEINGKQRHVVGYLRGFLFSAKRAMSPVRILSGGERNRVILARLFTRASNLLVLDEPTNDLDVETLEVLEARLAEYAGTLIVVSHDREFLDNVVDSILVFEDDGRVHEYVGGYSDWLARGHRLAETDSPDKAARKAELRAASRSKQQRKNSRTRISENSNTCRRNSAARSAHSGTHPPVRHSRFLYSALYRHAARAGRTAAGEHVTRKQHATLDRTRRTPAALAAGKARGEPAKTSLANRPRLIIDDFQALVGHRALAVTAPGYTRTTVVFANRLELHDQAPFLGRAVPLRLVSSSAVASRTPISRPPFHERCDFCL